MLRGGENQLSSTGAVCGKCTRSYGSNQKSLKYNCSTTVGDVGIESNIATNHPQQEFTSAAQLAALQAQPSTDRAITARGSSHTPKFLAIEIPPTAAPLQALVSLAPPSAPHFYSLTSGPNPYWGQPSQMPTPTLVETPVLSLEHRLEELMDRKIAEAMSSKGGRQQSMVLEEDPFSLEVIAVPLPRDFKQPKMEKYDGSSDHVDHLSSKRVKKTAISLMQLAQGKDELLKDFIARFNRATLGIKELQMSTVVTAMMSGT
ncbi:Uncharacterized protein Adt_39147 [Abeliophyllum distichum]|uniref:Uncharacterized protein n=1 Tax=Abeliophyllum distichum TaxID=126358 RepID=A0ABD1Q8G7_9LAMI